MADISSVPPHLVSFDEMMERTQVVCTSTTTGPMPTLMWGWMPLLAANHLK